MDTDIAVTALEAETEAAGAVLIERACYLRRLLASTAVSGNAVGKHGVSTKHSQISLADRTAAISLYEGSSSLFAAEMAEVGSLAQLLGVYEAAAPHKPNQSKREIDPSKRKMLIDQYSKKRVGTPAKEVVIPSYVRGTLSSRARTPSGTQPRPTMMKRATTPHLKLNNAVSSMTTPVSSRTPPRTTSPNRMAKRQITTADPLDAILRRRHNNVVQNANNGGLQIRYATGFGHHSPISNISTSTKLEDPKSTNGSLILQMLDNPPTGVDPSHSPGLLKKSDSDSNAFVVEDVIVRFDPPVIKHTKDAKVLQLSSSGRLDGASPPTVSFQQQTQHPAAPIPTAAHPVLPKIISRNVTRFAPARTKSPATTKSNSNKMIQPTAAPRPRHTALDHEGIMAMAQRIAEMERRLAEKIAEKLSATDATYKDEIRQPTSKSKSPVRRGNRMQRSIDTNATSQREDHDVAANDEHVPDRTDQISHVMLMDSDILDSGRESQVQSPETRPSEAETIDVAATHGYSSLLAQHETSIIIASNENVPPLDHVNLKDKMETKCSTTTTTTTTPSLKATYTYSGLAHISAMKANRL